MLLHGIQGQMRIIVFRYPHQSSQKAIDQRAQQEAIPCRQCNGHMGGIFRGDLQHKNSFALSVSNWNYLVGNHSITRNLTRSFQKQQ